MPAAGRLVREVNARLTRGAPGVPSFQERRWPNDDIGLIAPDEIAYRLELTPPELKLTYNALKTLLNDFGHDEHDVQRIIRSVLNKLSPPESIESIDLHLPRWRPRL